MLQLTEKITHTHPLTALHRALGASLPHGVEWGGNPAEGRGDTAPRPARVGASGPKPRRGAGRVGSRYRPRSTQTHGGEGGRQSLRGALAAQAQPGWGNAGWRRAPGLREAAVPALPLPARRRRTAPCRICGCGRLFGREESAAAGLGPALRRAGFHHARPGGWGWCRAARRTSPCRCRPVAPCPPCYAACAASSARPPPSSAPGPPRPRPPWTVRKPRRCWRPFGRRCGSR